MELTDEHLAKPDYDLFFRRDGWTIDEAICLLFGINPKFGNDTSVDWKLIHESIEDDESNVISEARKTLINSIDMELIKAKKIRRNSRNECVFALLTPVDFILWVQEKKYKLPVEFILNPESQAEIDKKAKDEILNQEKGRHDYVTAIPANFPSIEQSKRAGKRWGPKKREQEKIRSFVKTELDNGCLCTHREMRNFLITDAIDESGNMVYEDEHLSEQVLLRTIKEVFLEMAPDRIVGKPNYVKHEFCPRHTKARV